MNKIDKWIDFAENVCVIITMVSILLWSGQQVRTFITYQIFLYFTFNYPSKALQLRTCLAHHLSIEPHDL